jgi:hypothetical protein
MVAAAADAPVPAGSLARPAMLPRRFRSSAPGAPAVRVGLPSTVVLARAEGKYVLIPASSIDLADQSSCA